jgi:hypothetical protein
MNYEQLISGLKQEFAVYDAKLCEDTQAWAKGRCEALAAFHNSAEYEQLRHNAWKLYARLYSIAGGKGWYEILKCGVYTNHTKTFIAKSCAAIADQRFHKIAQKLYKENITAITGKVTTNSQDGFEGVYKVTTNAGEKYIKIRIVYAGGYNIQCAHIRVLVTIK